MALIEKLTAVADAIRGKTGGTEKLTLDGMATAIAGMEAGGGGGLAYDMGEFVLDTDANQVKTTNGIPHNLGDVPDFVLIWTDDFADLSAENVSPYSTPTNCGYCLLSGLYGLPQRITSAVSIKNGIYAGSTVGGGGYTVSFAPASSGAYGPNNDVSPTAEKIGLFNIGNNNLWRTVITYKYFVSKAWWNVGGVANAQ